MALSSQRVVIIGGSSGMGLGCAIEARDENAEVIIASRSEDKLIAASNTLGNTVKTHVLDIQDEASVAHFFTDLGHINHLVITAAAAGTGPIRKMNIDVAHNFFETKFWGAYYCAKHAAPIMSKAGSITFVSGVASRRPMHGLAVAGACNGALESLGRALALELSPIRVNTVSPGLVETPLYAKMPEPQKEAFFSTTAKQLPAQRIGQPSDIGQTITMIMNNGYITGTVIDVDGGNMVAM